MSRQRRPTEELPACYATTVPGLEPIAGDELRDALGADIKRDDDGLVVFRVSTIDADLLRLRTTDDVFLLAWGSDTLTYRATDLDLIRKWTAHHAKWEQLLRLHHSIRPKPKGRPTYRLVAQMTGEHGYRRVDALKALARGLTGKLPESWRPAEENAVVEIWLTIHGNQAVCGLRLSDRTMRHRTYKLEHVPASLRPTVAAAMVRVAQCGPGHVVVDPLCGAGTILAECLVSNRQQPQGSSVVLGGDIDAQALRSAGPNLRRFGEPMLCRWDATRLPLGSSSVDRIVSNPPFGKQMSSPELVGPLYRRLVPEFDRVLRPGGRVVLLASDLPALKEAIRPVGWKQEGQWRLRLLGQSAILVAWRKPREMVILD